MALPFVQPPHGGALTIGSYWTEPHTGRYWAARRGVVRVVNAYLTLLELSQSAVADGQPMTIPCQVLGVGSPLVVV
jgi:hypothetical protein